MKQILNKIKQNKKLLIPITSILLLITLCIGTTYAVFNYSNDNAGNNDINSGFISMTYTEPSNEYVVENALPMKDAEGMNSSNYFEFSVTTKVPTNDTDDEGVLIPYEITITESEDNTLTNDKVKMFLTEVEGENELVNINPTLVSYLEPSLYKDEGTKVGFNLHLHRNGNETVTKKYRLRAWIDNDVDVSDWDTAGGFIYKFRVNVNGEASYQGYHTDLSCFTYEKYDNNGHEAYQITGYDYDTCGGKNIVIPDVIKEEQTLPIILENINWVSDEEFIEAYKNYAYEQGMCSTDITWEDCLVQQKLTEEALLAEYPGLKTQLSLLIGTKKVDMNEETLEQLNGLEDMGFYTLEWSEEEKIIVDIKVDNIKSFTNTNVVTTNNSNLLNSPNNLNNIINEEDYNNLKLVADNNKINNIVVPEAITIEKDIFSTYEIDNIIDKKGNFPFGCFEYTSDGSSITINGYKCKGVTNLRIPSEIDGLPVITIGNYVYLDMKLTSVVIPNSVTTIGAAAFYLNQLASVVIPNSVTSIGDSAFYYNKLASVVISNSVTTINNSVFAYNQLISVDIPNSVTSIGNYAFHDNNLTSVEIPNSVTSIESYAFARNQLTSVEIPDSVTTIGNSAFENNKLTSVDIPNSVTSIDARAFCNNPNLIKVNNKTGLAFDWNNIINGSASDPFITGTVTNKHGNVEITTE